ncbi:MAG: hypothetical protein ACRDYU_03890 [Actinomycetes bacterium]
MDTGLEFQNLPDPADAEVRGLVDAILTLPDTAQRSLIATLYRYIVGYERSGEDVEYLRRFARAARDAAVLHSSKVFNDAFTATAPRVESPDDLVSVEEVLARRQ